MTRRLRVSDVHGHHELRILGDQPGAAQAARVATLVRISSAVLAVLIEVLA